MTEWINAERVSEMTGMTLDHLKKLRHEKKVFPYYKPTERTVLSNLAEVEAVIASSKLDTRKSA